MSFLSDFLDKLPEWPFGQKQTEFQAYFALNITTAYVSASVWGLDDNRIVSLGTGTVNYQGEGELLEKSKLALDRALAELEFEPRQILLGVPPEWSSQDNLKPEYLKLLKTMVRELGLSPMAFVTTPHALMNYLQKKDGILPTALLLGIGNQIEATLLRAGVIIDQRIGIKDDHLFEAIEKTLLQFGAEVEVLPSKIWVYGTSSNENLDKLKDELVSYPWVNKLPFLHFPKIDVFTPEVLSQAVILAGALEINPDINFKQSFQEQTSDILAPVTDLAQVPLQTATAIIHQSESFLSKNLNKILKYLPTNSIGGRKLPRLIILPILVFLLATAYLFLAQAEVGVLVEPKLLENTATVTADPKAKSVDEAQKIIPGKVVETSVQGTVKAVASGQKNIGNPSRGKVIVYNLSSTLVSYPAGTTLASESGTKFTLDTSVQIASQSSSVGSDFTTIIKPGKSSSIGVTAVIIGPESNLPAGVEMGIGGSAKSVVVAKVDEALSGGTSKMVTVVSSDDQKKLQARLVDDLRQTAQHDLQVNLNNNSKDPNSPMKIIPEALVVVDGKYSFSKAVGDQASEFSLNGSVHFKGTSFADNDLKNMVGKLVSTNVPEGFQISLPDSETEANLSKIEKDDKVVFLAKFKAKLLPKLSPDDLKNRVWGKSIPGAISSLKELPNVLGGEIKMKPNLGKNIGWIPILKSHITITLIPQ